MNIEDLQEKVAKSGEKVEKTKTTIERHKTQKEKKGIALQKKGIDLNNYDAMMYRQTDLFWEIRDYERKDDDIETATRKLKDTQRVYDNWVHKLNLEVTRMEEVERCVPEIIKEFVEKWKVTAIEWTLSSCTRYEDYVKHVNETKSKILEELFTRYVTVDMKGNPDYERYRSSIDWYKENHYYMKNALPKEMLEEKYSEQMVDKSTVIQKLAFFGEIVVKAVEYRDLDKRQAFIEKKREGQKKEMLIDLMLRIHRVVGNITDASDLSIGSKGEINGLIVGDKSKANINTIRAGGWNIQCFHFRTLIHEVK